MIQFFCLKCGKWTDCFVHEYDENYAICVQCGSVIKR